LINIYRPGWEEIFRMNQSQLERAVRTLSSDPNLDPRRKAYLIQNLMASKYIVAQQQKVRAHSFSFLFYIYRASIL
jgi:zinc finger protein-like protein